MAATIERNTRTALVIGATGGLGKEVTSALLKHGWHVRALARKPKPGASGVAGLSWVQGDAMKAADIVSAAAGVTLIVHATNPPGYRNWRGLAIPMLASAIAAAKATGARLILPGNIYNYGHDAFPVLTEASPQNPISSKGAVRVDMEKMLQATAAEGVRSLVVRAGDFFGPDQPASWIKDLMIKPGKPITKVVYPGEPDIGHAWAYLPDLAETIARVAEVEQTLPRFDTFHFSGHWLPRGDDMAKAILRAAGKSDGAITSAPWMLFGLLSPFVTFLREAREMRYLWRLPVRLDNTKLQALIGPEPHTPLDVAVTATLHALGCLPEPSRARVS